MNVLRLVRKSCRKPLRFVRRAEEELRNETIDLETYEKRCNEAINQAMSVFDKAIAANPENSNFHYQRGLAMVKWNKLDTDAHEYFDKAIELKPFYAEAY